MKPDENDSTSTARLYAMARALTGALTAVDVATAVFDRMAELGACTTGLWLVESGTVRFVGGAGLADRLPASISAMPLDSDMPATVAIRNQRILTIGSPAERIRRWPELAPVPTVSLAIAVLPLIASGRALGCLHIGYPVEMSAEQFDLPFLERLAELCSAALDRAQLHDADRDRQALLIEASAAVAHSQGFADALARLARVAVPRLADLCLIDVQEAPHRIRRMAAVHADPEVQPLVDELQELYSPEPGSQHPASQAMSAGRSHWMGEMPDDYLRATTRDQHHFELTRRLGFTSFVCVPLMVAGESLGAITLVSAGSGRRFGAADLSLAEDLADHVADVVAAARRHERDREMAHTLQRLLLPEALPAIEGLEICARYYTAQRDLEAGGDFYDVVRLPSGRVGFMIGDVEGHDTEAAALMGQLRSAIRALSGQHREPHQLMNALRWSWDLLGFSRLVTCVMGRLDQDNGTLVLCSAGHLPPVLVVPEGGAQLLHVEQSPPLGVPSGPAVESCFNLEPGATLFLYTDGLVENSREGIDAELARLCHSLGNGAARSISDMCDGLVDNPFLSGDRPDDVAMLAIRRLRSGGGSPTAG